MYVIKRGPNFWPSILKQLKGQKFFYGHSPYIEIVIFVKLNNVMFIFPFTDGAIDAQTSASLPNSPLSGLSGSPVNQAAGRYSCNNTTQIKISRQNWNGFFSNISNP